MAKDVDLSSKEWRDIVFDGKNMEYGAYQLRRASNGRHNKAMIVIVIVIAIMFALAYFVNTVIKSAEERPEDEIEQVMAEMVTEEVEEEVEEEPQRIEEQQPEVIKEELLNTAKMTEVAIVEDEQVDEEIKSQDELKEDDRAVGTVNEDRGVDDIINAQEHKEAVVVEEKTEPVEENKIYEAVEQEPEFPGGRAALQKWIYDHLHYPPIALENGIQGSVVIRFVVGKDGKVGEAKILKSIDPDLDKEAVRVVKELPDFSPGRMNGHPVSVWYTLPIKFKINN